MITFMINYDERLLTINIKSQNTMYEGLGEVLFYRTFA